MTLDKAHKLFVIGIVVVLCVFVAAVVATLAIAADTLPAVSPPTDWTGVFVVMAFGLLLAAAMVAGYTWHVRRTPGKQLGEDEIERIAEAVRLKTQTVITWNVPPVTPDPLVYDGLTFHDQSKLDEYKAAKAIVDSHKGGTT